VDKNQLFSGDELKGAVILRCEEPLEIEQITASLKCIESIKKTRHYQKVVQVGTNQRTLEPINRTVWEEEDYWDSATIYTDHAKLCGFLPTMIGVSTDFRFSFKIPITGRESYHSVQSRLLWSLSVVAKVKGRMSFSSQDLELLVSKPLLSSPVTVKEVVKEVVLIPCLYCSGLMPQTSIFCPNCGARRKA
jgi:hypothetical protein